MRTILGLGMGLASGFGEVEAEPELEVEVELEVWELVEAVDERPLFAVEVALVPCSVEFDPSSGSVEVVVGPELLSPVERVLPEDSVTM